MSSGDGHDGHEELASTEVIVLEVGSEDDQQADTQAKADKAAEEPTSRATSTRPRPETTGPLLRVRRMHRRDINRIWEFIKLTFRDVNRQTVEYQRPRSKKRFAEIYEEEGVEQLIFELVTKEGERPTIVGYAECAFEITGSDNWMNQRYFDAREMRPLFVEELAVHPEARGMGIGSFILEQLEHIAKVRGCTHLVLEVAENNDLALKFYRSRNFHKLDAAIFMAKKVKVEAELLPPRRMRTKPLKAPAAKRAKPKKRATKSTKATKTTKAAKSATAPKKAT